MDMWRITKKEEQVYFTTLNLRRYRFKHNKLTL